MESRTLYSVNFVADRTEKFNDAEKALEALPTFLTHRVHINPTELSFGYNGSAQLSIGNTKYATTENGVKSLCQILKIPNPFAKKIPIDLLQENINRLASQLDKEIDVVFDMTDNIVAFIPNAYRPIRMTDFFKILQQKFSATKPENLKITLNPRNCLVDYFVETSPSVEPQVGDFLRFGISLTNSETHELDASASILVYRLVCSNGAVLGTEWGKIKRATDKKLPYEKMVSNFEHRIQNFQSDFDKLTILLGQLPNIFLNTVEVSRVFKALDREFGDDTAHDLLGITPEEMVEICKFEKDRTNWRAVGDLNTSSYGMAPRQTTVNAYSVYNRITEFARDIQAPVEHRKGTAIGGGLLTLVCKNRSITCVARV